RFDVLDWRPARPPSGIVGVRTTAPRCRGSTDGRLGGGGPALALESGGESVHLVTPADARTVQANDFPVGVPDLDRAPHPAPVEADEFHCVSRVCEVEALRARRPQRQL